MSDYGGGNLSKLILITQPVKTPKVLKVNGPKADSEVKPKKSASKPKKSKSADAESRSTPQETEEKPLTEAEKQERLFKTGKRRSPLLFHIRSALLTRLSSAVSASQTAEGLPEPRARAQSRGDGLDERPAQAT